MKDRTQYEGVLYFRTDNASGTEKRQGVRTRQTIHTYTSQTTAAITFPETLRSDYREGGPEVRTNRKCAPNVAD